MVLHVPGDIAGLDRRGGFEPPHLLDRIGDQTWLVDEFPALSRMIGRQRSGPADQAGRRLVAGPGEEQDVAEYLLTGQRALDAAFVGLRGIQQFGHQVVRWMLGPPVDVVGKVVQDASTIG